jgi:CRP-like cAMP-binding protein
MTTPPAPTGATNRLLSHLPDAEQRRLAPLLQPVPLKRKQVLHQRRAAIGHVYFPTTGVVSAMAVMGDGAAIEVATIGREGWAGLNAFVGGSAATSPYEVMVQVEGRGLRMPTDALARESRDDGPLRRLLVLYHSAFTTQVSYAVACNGLHTVQARCCRWLLMTHDRVGADALPLTHEFLGIMLGVRRASVTEVLKPLQEEGVVRVSRGLIEVLDRPALEKLACECYRAVVGEYERLLGPARA